MSKQPEYRHEPERPTGFTLHLEFHHRESGEPPADHTRPPGGHRPPPHGGQKDCVSPQPLQRLVHDDILQYTTGEFPDLTMLGQCWAKSGWNTTDPQQTHHRPTTGHRHQKAWFRYREHRGLVDGPRSPLPTTPPPQACIQSRDVNS